MFFKKLLQSSTVRLALIALVLCGVTLVGSRSTGEAKAAGFQQSAQSTLESSYSIPGSVSSPPGMFCNGLSSAVRFDSDDFIIICADRVPDTNIFTFFVPGAESRRAARAMAYAIAANNTTNELIVYYNSTASTDPRCKPDTCRELLEIAF